MNSNLKLLCAFFAGLLTITFGCAKDNPLSDIAKSNMFENTSQVALRSDFSDTYTNSYSKKTLVTLAEGENLYRFINSTPGVVLIDFYADWCGPCQKQGDVLHDMEATASKQNARIIKVNVDTHSQLAKHFKVTSLPTLLLVKEGKVVERRIGLADQARIASLLKQ